MELAFQKFGMEIVFLGLFQYSSNMVFMHLYFFWKNEDVVEVDDNKDISHVVENIVHEVLEDSKELVILKGITKYPNSS